MSPLPISRSALDKLGERLAAAEHISDEDYDLLLQVLTAYQAALGETQERLAGLGYAPTTRVKTTTVLIEKLRRETGMKLKGVQDIAGARIVADCTRLEQDEIVRRIVAGFADGSREPKIRDRRAEPSAGYRAVHVVVTVQDVPVEIQVRTRRQDQWAQIVEALGDKWGRGIRYGEPPEDPEAPLIAGSDTSREDLWSLISDLAEIIDLGERIELALDLLDAFADKTLTTVEVDRATAISAFEALARSLTSAREIGADVDRLVAERTRIREEWASEAVRLPRMLRDVATVVDALQ